MSALYGAHAQNYLDAGWPCVIPIPAGKKSPPPVGFTGNDHPDTDQATVDQWKVSHSDWSIAIRIAPGVVGIDVDHYDKLKTLPDGTTETVKKRGADDLAAAEERWGKLPPSWRSSARELPSGIRFFRVPAGVKFCKGIGDMDVIQRHHRYIMVAPSINPDSGTVYRLYRPDGSLADPGEVPRLEDLPALPDRWFAGLQEGASQTRTAPAAKGAAATMLAAIEADVRPMCSAIEIAANRAVAQLNAANSGSRHDTAMARTMRIIGLAAEGHAGGGAALTRARDAWGSVTAGEGREYEFDSLVAGAAAQAAGAVALSQPRELDPCDGAAGAGIVVINPDVTTPRAVLIVEGLDDARMCAEYAGGSTVVIGMAGRESWRGVDGVPVPQLRAVSELPVTVLPGPDVATDLVTWRAYEDLGVSAVAKGAAGVMFTQPPGTRGVRIATYLNSLTEAERVGELEHMRVAGAISVPFKPKPKERRKLGAEDTGELPPTDDTSLGTIWGDDHLGQFRYLVTDVAWLMYRDGRWATDGAKSEVGHMLMEFLSEVAGPLQAIRAKSGDPDERDKYQRAIDALLSTRKRQAVATTASDYRPMAVRRDQLDQHPKLFAVANGVLNLETGIVGPHDPALLLTTGSDVEYRQDATCERFDAFLAQVQPDQAMQDYILEIFAMAMFGEVIEHVLPVFIGDGRNGKGVLLKIMQAVFGSHAQVINSKVLLKRKFDGHDVEVAQLAGKRLAVAEETGQDSQWDAARINDWTGNVRLNGRFMHGNPFTFEPSHTLVMVTNHRPTVGQGERAFWERYREVPFTQDFSGGKGDPRLASRIIAEELPGVLNRLIEAGRRYLVDGLAEPAAVTVATLDAKVNSDYFARWCSRHLELTGKLTDKTDNPVAYKHLDGWWRQHVPAGVASVPSDRAFPKKVAQELGITDPEQPKRTRGVRRWEGVKWHPEGRPEAAEGGADDTSEGGADNPGGSDYRHPPAWSPPPRLDLGAALRSLRGADGADNGAGGELSAPPPASENSQVNGHAGADGADGADNSDSFTPTRGREQNAPVDHDGVSISPCRGIRSENIGTIGTIGTRPVSPDEPTNGATVTPIGSADPGSCPGCGKAIPAEKRARHLSHCKKAS